MTKRVVRVLILDGDRPSGSNRMEGLEVQATLEGRSALHRPDGGGYRVTAHSIGLAQNATLANYDAVVIGNNEGYGRQRAHAIPPEMRPRTLIVWNRLDLDDVAIYRAMGYSRFGQRYSSDECELGVREFLLQVAAEMYGPQ